MSVNLIKLSMMDTCLYRTTCIVEAGSALGMYLPVPVSALGRYLPVPVSALGRYLLVPVYYLDNNYLLSGFNFLGNNDPCFTNITTSYVDPGGAPLLFYQVRIICQNTAR